MTQPRKYSVAEIRRMRSAIADTFEFGVSFKPDARAVEVETQLRTYMQNGTTPEELEEHAEMVIESRAAMGESK